MFSLGKILNKPKEKEEKNVFKKTILSQQKFGVQKQILGHKKVKVKKI